MIPVGDYLRDALAVLFLLIPLGMADDLAHHGVGYDILIPVTMLSIISLALPYLKAASVLPRSTRPRQLQVLRLLANTPYLAFVVIMLVFGYVGADATGEAGGGRGVGVAVTIGLVGVLLAAQGRAWEQRDGLNDGRLWRGIVVGIAALGVLLGTLSIVVFLIESGGDVGWSTVVVLILATAFFAGVPLIAVHGLAQGDGVWRDVTLVLGLVGLLSVLWAQGAAETMAEVWSPREAGPQFMFWPAIGAAAAAAGIAAVAPPPSGAARWINLSGRLFQTATLVAVLSILLAGFRLVDHVDARGQYITVLVLSLVALVVATYGRNSLVRDAREGQARAMGAAVALIGVAFLTMAVLGISRAAVITVDTATIICTWFVFAVVVIVALTVPNSVNQELDSYAGEQGEVREDDDESEEHGESPLSEPVAEHAELHAEDESIWSAHTEGQPET
ncbi:hypothetical protein [Phytoactinopolyspora mesophila]|uniref:DUF7937 domain-containing protein n=1 Tax=Phytoactinopolyspora mesophila TaxID=2650750 RepID=A0A7K3LYR2_9ACTN|nr:hypothetical protein [Phytoactinopolyspora mesophila]NDL56173.1 hypothetical protein [Phytoactinopolyspora mesophila]